MLLSFFIYHELIVLSKEFLKSLHGARSMLRVHWMTVNIRVFDNQITTHSDESAIELHFCEYMRFTVIRVQDNKNLLLSLNS